MDQQKQHKDDTDKKYENMKKLLKACEKKSNHLSHDNSFDRRNKGYKNVLTTQSTRGKAHFQKVSGIDIICNETRLSWALSLWVCGRINDDLTRFWGRANISDCSSTFAVMLFGIQRRDGYLPCTTKLGKDLGLQARAIVGRLLWTARCSAPNSSKYTASIPRWLFALVPIVRDKIERSPSNTDSGSSSQERTSAGEISDRTPDFRSTR